MTLRRRLLLATSALAVVLLVAGTAVLLVQRLRGQKSAH